MTRFYILFLLVIPVVSRGQQSKTSSDSTLYDGGLNVHARTFFMRTINKDYLPDYYALATGVGIGYKSPSIKNFSMAISGSLTYRVVSTDLSIPDPPLKRLNRYEVGLFDITDSAYRKHIERMEEFYLQYKFQQSLVLFGRLKLNTPFINPQDGRMSPTLAQGIWIEMNEIKKLKIEMGWITHVSPRSTGQWYKVRNSIGLYPSGVNVVGEPSNYAGNTKSKGIGLAGIKYENKSLSVSVWNMWIENISNTTMIRLEDGFKVKKIQLYGGVQLIHQEALASGGNQNPQLAYMDSESHTNTVSIRAGWSVNRFDMNINSTAITGNGRYLVPREWGNDPFYTSLPRERNEGSGQVRAISLNLSYEIPTLHLNMFLGAGHYALPPIEEHALNKYAMPSYNQLNVAATYSFTGWLKDASIQAIYVYKQSNDYGDAINQLNKVNMSNINLIFNYYFQRAHLTSTSRHNEI